MNKDGFELPFAEDVNYWKSGRSAPDTIIDEVCEMIEDCGGEVTQRLMGKVRQREAIRIQFELLDKTYLIVWPVLESRGGDTMAARRQATTFVKHDIKAKVMVCKVLGPERAFFDYLCLPDGRPVYEVSAIELAKQIPRLELKE